MIQTSLSKSEKLRLQEPYTEDLKDYLRKVESFKKGSRPCIHIFKIDDQYGILPVEFPNLDSPLRLVEQGWFNFEKSNKIDCQFFLDLDKLARGCLNKQKDLVFVVINGYVCSTILVKRNGSKSVVSKGFKV